MLGRLVKGMNIKCLEETYLFSLPIKEFEITAISSGSLQGEVL